MQSHQRGTMRLDTHLTRLLWALAKKSGGELRISGYDLDDVPDKCAIVTDYDPVDHSYVIQSRSGVSDTIVINVGEQWTRTQEPNSPPSAVSSPPPAPNRSAVHSDQDLADIEHRLLQRAAERKRQRDSAEGIRAQRAVAQE